MLPDGVAVSWFPRLTLRIDWFPRPEFIWATCESITKVYGWLYRTSSYISVIQVDTVGDKLVADKSYERFVSILSYKLFWAATPIVDTTILHTVGSQLIFDVVNHRHLLCTVIFIIIYDRGLLLWRKWTFETKIGIRLGCTWRFGYMVVHHLPRIRTV